jgi:hypothetical protein
MTRLGFKFLAFRGLPLPQMIGKIWMVLLSIPVIAWMRRRDEQFGTPICT